MEAADFIISGYSQIQKLQFEEMHQVGEDIPLPTFEVDTIRQVITAAKQVFMQQDILIKKNHNYIIIGDLHGSIFDLLTIFSVCGYPPKTNYALLGDYVDCGEFSLECITLLFAYQAKYPNSFHLIRGNHEFREINHKYGFYEEIISKVHDERLWEEFNESFDYMPLIGIINDSILLLHGGISPHLKSIKKILKIQRPVIDFSNPLVDDIVWSDPTTAVMMFAEITARGHGNQFGKIALKETLESLGLKILIRAHQCVDGVETKWNNSLITVFSLSAYMGSRNNKSGFVSITNEGIFRKALPIAKKSAAKDVLTFNAVYARPLDPGQRRLISIPSNAVFKNRRASIGPKSSALVSILPSLYKSGTKPMLVILTKPVAKDDSSN